MLESQLQDTPAIFAFWSAVLAEQRETVSKIERQIKHRRGEIVRELIDQSRLLAANGGGIGSKPGLRKSDIDDLVEADEGLRKLDAMYIRANKVLSKLFAIKDAMQMRFDSLRSMAAMKRAEMDRM